jgi:isopenicillin N synthase-like dioxygenase
MTAAAQSELVLHNDPVLPVIDFSSFASTDETKGYPREIIEKLANACEHVGFFYAIGIYLFLLTFIWVCLISSIGHGVSNDLLSRTLSVTRQLFDLDLKIKNQYASRLFMNSSNLNEQITGLGRGYQSVGENVTNTKRDRHEGFDLYRELESNHPLRLQYNEKNLTNKKLPDYREMAIGRNPWPKEFPQFKETLNEYVSAMLRAGERVMRAIALSLNLPLNFFQPTFNDSFWVK